jgi:hypothetical protein
VNSVPDTTFEPGSLLPCQPLAIGLHEAQRALCKSI